MTRRVLAILEIMDQWRIRIMVNWLTSLSGKRPLCRPYVCDSVCLFILIEYCLIVKELNANVSNSMYMQLLSAVSWL